MPRLASILLLVGIPLGGCAMSGSPPSQGWGTVVEANRIGCPAFSAADKAEARRFVARPEADITGPDGKPWVSKGRQKQWTDDLELAVLRKARAMQRMDREHEACRGKGPTS